MKIKIRHIMYIEILGYLGSIIIIFSICTTNMITYRIRDCVGCIILSIYGFIRGTYPTVLISMMMLCIHIVFFINYILKRKDIRAAIKKISYSNKYNKPLNDYEEDLFYGNVLPICHNCPPMPKVKPPKKG